MAAALECASAEKSHLSVLCFHISRDLLIAAFRARAAKGHFVPQYGLVRAARSEWRISAARIKGTPGPVRTFVHPAANGGSEPKLSNFLPCSE